MQSKTGVQAALEGKCPKCRKGDIFKFPLVRYIKATEMNETCPNCGLRFQIEPGFFFGAMYVSYVFTVGLLLISGLSLYLIGVESIWIYISTVFLLLLIFLPLIFRYSRIIFLHVFGGVRYDSTVS